MQEKIILIGDKQALVDDYLIKLRGAKGTLASLENNNDIILNDLTDYANPEDLNRTLNQINKPIDPLKAQRIEEVKSLILLYEEKLNELIGNK